LWEWAAKVLTPEEIINNMFLAKDNCRGIPWCVAAEKGLLVVLHEELHNKIFLYEDIRGRTAWYVAAENGGLDTLHKLWECAKRD
jgi:hypothetical protein